MTTHDMNRPEAEADPEVVVDAEARARTIGPVVDGADTEAWLEEPVVESAAPTPAHRAERRQGTGRVTKWLYSVTGGLPILPLAVLFGLNMADELDRTAFGVLLPEIRDSFGLDTGGILTVVTLALLAALIIALPIGFLSDRMPRLPVAISGALGWAVFSVMTGLAPTLLILGIARAGSGLGRAVNEPVHNSLLADYYDIPQRPRVYGVHRYANAAGQFIGPLVAGVMAFYLGWRAPFMVFGVVTVVFVLIAFKLREPVRGSWERKAMGASDDVINTEEVAPSWAESFRIIWEVRSLRRIFFSLPFVAVAVVGLATLSGLYYDEVWNFNEAQRGFLSAGMEGGAQLVGLLIGLPLATRLMMKGAGHVLRFLAVVSLVITGAWAVFALAPVLPIALVANVVISASFFLLVPGIFAVLSLAMPAKVRAFGFAIGTLWVLPGLLLLPVIGGFADHFGIRTGLLIVVPVFVVGGWILSTGGQFVEHDIQQVWKSAAARSEVALLRSQGKVKLLLCRDIDVHYDNVQVLFGVNLEVDEGEIVALLGTNGAGKSTLLKAISGLVQASSGAIDLRRPRHDPHAARRDRRPPGRHGRPRRPGRVPHLTVGENLRLAAWNERKRGSDAKADTARVLDMFPMLRERLHEPAGNLSGGQQQMLTLGMAFIGSPAC